jgi:hypothetical protein
MSEAELDRVVDAVASFTAEHVGAFNDTGAFAQSTKDAAAPPRSSDI